MLALRKLLRAGLLGALLAVHLVAAETAKPYDLPASDAAKALKQFSEVSGREILFAAPAVRGLKTPPVKGTYTAQQALDVLLANTGLIAVLDAKTGAFAVRKETPEETKNDSSRRANDAAAEPAAAANGTIVPGKTGVLQLEKVEVTGSRIRSVLGDQGINPVLTYTREDIERSGVASLADLRDLIPQLAVGSVNSFDGNSSGSTPEGRLIVNMRGITGANTLVLVDGRRLPKTGQRGVTEAYELTGIALSSVERVEVLTDGGSAVYGSDAVAGVINIITRKNHTGTDLEFSIDNTFDKDAALKRGAINVNTRRGKLGLRASAAYEEQNAMSNSDRWWLASSDRRPLGGTDGRATTPIGGQVLAVSVAQGGSGTLPGTGGATVLRIPTNSDGRNLTIADFVAAGAPTDADRYDPAKYTNAVNAFFRTNASLVAEYDVAPWLQLTARGSFSRYRSYGLNGPILLSTSTNTFNPTLTTTLPANYPGNPFGVPINVQKYLWEIGDLNRRYQYDNYSFMVGANGLLPGDWRYDAGISWSMSDPTTLDPSYQFDTTKLAPALRGSNPPILLNNSLTSGPVNPDGFFTELFLEGSNREIPQTWTYDFKADGPVYTWWGGEINLAVGGEVREEYIAFERENFAATTESAQPDGHRTVSAAFAETVLPLVSPANKVPFVHHLYVSGAMRYDSYNDFGEVSKPRSGIAYKPFKWLMFRGSRGDAYKVPSLVDLTRPTGRQTQTFAATGSFVLFDTFRNEQVIGPVVNVTGGNPNLLPEESRNETWGILIEPPFKFLKGLSFGVNYSDIRITNRVGSVTYQERLAFRPDMFTRADPTAADLAAGIPGRITEVDNRSINIALFNSAAFDYLAKYSRDFGRWGSFDWAANVTKQDKYEAITRPGLPPTTFTSNILRPLRGTSSLDWYKSGIGLGVTAIYQEGYRTSATSATSAKPSTLLWNARVSYNFDQGKLHPTGGRTGRWLQGVRVNLAILNALNEEPPRTTTGVASGAINPRLIRYVFTVRKAL